MSQVDSLEHKGSISKIKIFQEMTLKILQVLTVVFTIWIKHLLSDFYIIGIVLTLSFYWYLYYLIIFFY